MKRIEQLIYQARNIAKNIPNTDGSVSITDDEILQYINDAQDRLQALISSLKSSSRLFLTTKIVPTVANQESYDINDRVFFNKQFHQVEFSYSGMASDYLVLEKTQIFKRDSNTTNQPWGYWRSGSQFFPVAIPSTSQGSFRVMYERSLDDVDKRRGQITTVTGLTSTTFTSITINTNPDETSLPVNLTNIDYVCINDAFGNVKAYNIPVLSYDSATNVLTPSSSFVFQTGETIAVGDYVTLNKWTTTNSKLPDECERYLIHYAAEMMLHKDSSNDVIKQSEKLQMMEADILNQIGSQTGEIARVPTTYDWYMGGY